MGLFDKIFKRPEVSKPVSGAFQTFTAYSPVFTSWSGELYESQLVQDAIHARATHISKLAVTVQGAAKPKLQSRLKAGPNEWMTWGQFLYRLSTILDVQNTAFLVPVEDYYGATVGLYPLLPSRCEVVEVEGEAWLRYRFHNGLQGAMEMKRCGILTKFQYRDDFFGEPNRALNPTMELIELQNQGIAEGVKNAATFRFMAKVSNFSSPEDLAKERKRFTRDNLQADSGGILLFPNVYSDIRQIESKPFVVDAEQMAMIRENVFEHFGVNEDILQNRAYGDAWSAFYDGAIEPFVVQFSDVVTRMLFTQRERLEGALVMATANRLQYMTTTEKLNVSAQMADRGIMNRDEIRQIWSLPPLPDGQGQSYTIRGEYYLLGPGGTVTKKGDDLTHGADIDPQAT